MQHRNFSKTAFHRSNENGRSKTHYFRTHIEDTKDYSSNKSSVFFCNNCGKSGHIFNQCKLPIMSSGVIAFRIHPTTKQTEYLMICRKDTLGYMDFLRGKFSVYQKYYILNMIKQMTIGEKTKLKNRVISEKSVSDLSTSDLSTSDLSISEISSNNLSTVDLSYESFSNLSHESFFNINRPTFDTTSEISFSRNTTSIPVKDKIRWLINGVDNKGDKYHLMSLIQETETDDCIQWEDPEWGFPKGRRNSQETDYDCALREFSEETGIPISKLQNVRNVVPFEELFTGSNYKSYRHKYFLMYMNYSESSELNTSFQRNEVSKIAWKSIDECIKIIRPYNLEKKRMIQNVDFCLKNTVLHYSNGVNI